GAGLPGAHAGRAPGVARRPPERAARGSRRSRGRPRGGAPAPRGRARPGPGALGAVPPRPRRGGVLAGRCRPPPRAAALPAGRRRLDAAGALALAGWGAGGEQIAVDAEEVVAAESGQVIGPRARVGLREALPAGDEGRDEPHQPGAEAGRLVAGIEDGQDRTVDDFESGVVEQAREAARQVRIGEVLVP